MAGRVDPALTRRARAAVARARKAAAAAKDGLSPWEDEFLASLDQRLETFGSAFVDPDKGAMNAPLSLRQGLKLKQIRRKGDPPPEAATPGAAPAEDEAAGAGAAETRPAQTRSRKPAKPLQTRKPLQARKPMARGKGFARRSAPARGGDED